MKYKPGFYNLALMELFGFIDIEPDLSGENWSISKIKPTALGDFLKYLYSTMFTEVDGLLLPNQTATLADIKEYIPDWQNDLKQPEEPEIHGIIVFTISLDSAWCKIRVPGDIDLDELASIILEAFKFDNDHLYEFVYKNRYGYTERILHPEMEHEGLTTYDCVVGQLPLYPGKELTFHFDFGDDWKFSLVVDSIDNDTIASDYKVIERHGKPPKQYQDFGY